MHAPTPADSLREYARGITGGLLFSLPMLYTMEVWWTGFSASPVRLLAGLGATYGLLLLYNRYAGLHVSASWREIAFDSVEEMGLGLLLSAVLLWFVGQIAPGMSVEEIVGKVLVEGLAVAIGVSVGTAQLGNGEEDQGMEGDRDDASILRTMALALCGAVIVAANVAPTDEIVRIAAETTSLHLLIGAGLSFGLGSLILHFAGFRGSESMEAHGGPGAVLRSSVVSYAVALVASTFLLWYFGRFGGISPLLACAEVVVLGLPAALGASAGRLLLQQSQS